MILTLETLNQHLIDKQPFAFTRWGDGELLAVAGVGKPNCDGHHRNADLRKKLKTILQEQNEKQTMYLGLQSIGEKEYQNHTGRSIRHDYPNIQWSDAEILHNASLDNDQHHDWPWRQFVKSCNNRSTTLFAANYVPHQLTDAEDTLIPDVIKPIPEKNCFAVPLSHIHRELTTLNLFCGSMAANVWIDEFWKLFSNHTYIDLGSVYDPYCGVVSRSYHKKIVYRLGIPEPDRIYKGSQRRK